MVLIGLNTVNGRRIINAPTSKDGRDAASNVFRGLPTPQGTVVLNVHDIEAGKIDKATLTRFSRTGADAFPRPMAAATSSSTHSAKFAKVSDTADNNEDKLLTLSHPNFWKMPSPEAFAFVLSWMEGARATPEGAWPVTCAVSDPDDVAFSFLCEVQAVILLLAVRPAQTVALEQIIERVRTSSPQVEMLKAIHETLPLRSIFITRYIEAFFDHLERGRYNQQEVKAIDEYAKRVDVQLFKCFAGVERSRKGAKRFQDRDQTGKYELAPHEQVELEPDLASSNEPEVKANQEMEVASGADVKKVEVAAVAAEVEDDSEQAGATTTTGEQAGAAGTTETAGAKKKASRSSRARAKKELVVNANRQKVPGAGGN
ncbi:hypothetical protein LTR09_000398 [Extremus antarcticus]|uniref:Uncharacterized protein n=1 Tax=Extremus antarcticus TaxID=702011 RepID=A0AAJ0GJP4_9PEZI|nr:hypothetical protein LTR09_000398 [Extremus antarcticus]